MTLYHATAVKAAMDMKIALSFSMGCAVIPSLAPIVAVVFAMIAVVVRPADSIDAMDSNDDIACR